MSRIFAVIALMFAFVYTASAAAPAMSLFDSDASCQVMADDKKDGQKEGEEEAEPECD